MELQEEGTIMRCAISRRTIFDIWHSKQGTEHEKSQHILDTLSAMAPLSENIENIDINILSDKIHNLCKRFSCYWKKTYCSQIKFIEKYADWLGVMEYIDVNRSIEPRILQQIDNVDSLPSCSRGRPKKDFNDCSKRSKRRRLAELSKLDTSAVNKLLNTSADANSSFTKIDEYDVLSLIAEAKLTRHQYLLIKNFIDTKISKDCMPSYQSIVKAKKQCYPPNITVTETSAEVELQSLLDHTATRILESQKDVLDRVPCGSLDKISLIGKWGFDGSTGHSEYKQCFSNPNLKDSSLFVTSYVPLQLIFTPENEENPVVLWKNPRPSSTCYCRPIRFQFLKETAEVTVQEETYFKQKIQNLQPTTFKYNDREFFITHNLQLTMVDGKVCNALSEFCSSARCYVCKASPNEMNQIDLCLSKTADASKYEFGLSPLHAMIRFFEYFIHIAYRMDFKNWQASKEFKPLYESRKKEIQTQFRERLGLIVDKPKSGGSGTSNDGNTARRFFTQNTPPRRRMLIV